MTKPEEHHNGKLRQVFIAGYLIIVFGAYFLSYVLSRLERIKGLFGL